MLASSLFAFFADTLLVPVPLDAEEGYETKCDEDEGYAEDDADYGWDGHFVAEVSIGRNAAFEELKVGCFGHWRGIG